VTTSAIPRARIGTPAVAAQIVGLGSLWGSAFVFTKVALRDLPPLQVTFCRLAVGSAALAVLVIALPGARSGLPRDPSAWRVIAALAALTAVVPFALITWGLVHLPSAAGAVTNATTPLFTAALAIALRREAWPSPLRWAGIVLGFAGVVTMVGAGFSGGPVLARLALLAAAAAFAGGFVVARSSPLAGTSPLVVGACQLTLAAAMMAPVAVALTLASDTSWSASAALAVLGLGVVSTGLPAIVYFRLVRAAGSTSASLATYVVPPVGIFLGWTFLSETLAPSAVAGAALIIVGISVAERGRRAGLPQEQP
jgi:drug/metabolite transporter (DMT)-like permease